jgi:hypothetical protein
MEAVVRWTRGPAHQPQQSVLKRQFGHRHTACIRYISAPQRSQRVASLVEACGWAFKAERIGVICGKAVGLGVSDTGRL